MAGPWEQYQPQSQPQAAPPAAQPWQKYAPKPSYQYLEPDDGQDEKIHFENSGQTVTAPAGTGRVFAQIQDDSAFDTPVSTFEETGAMFEKQAAYVALVANAYGLVPDDQIAGFVADRSRALAYAQKNQPEYMKEFNRQFEEAQGFFETAGVFLSHPRAMGRQVITQSPNSVLPLITTYLGAQGGALAGGAAGSVVPGAGTAVGAGVGALAGGAAGAVPGGALVEIGAEIDGMMQEAGVDITDATAVLQALGNDAFMQEIRAKAERKGITTASVDALFQVFGGRFLKAAKIRGAGKVGTVAAGTADVAVQSVGEGAGEAAGQYARDGKVNYKEAALEAVTSLGQSAGQTAIGATVGQAKKVATGKDSLQVEIVTERDFRAAKGEKPWLIDAQGTEYYKDGTAISRDGKVLQQGVFPGDLPSTGQSVSDDVAFDFGAVEPQTKERVTTLAQAAGVDVQTAAPEQQAALVQAFEGIKQYVPEKIEAIKAQLGEGFIPLPRQKPQSLSQFLIAQGGLKTDTGEAKRFTRKETPQLGGVAKKTGTLTLDEARALAVEAGFIRDTDDPNQPTISTVDDLLQALEDESNGVDIVRDQDYELLLQRRAIEDFNDQLDQMRQEQYSGEKPLANIRQAFKEGVRLAKQDVKAAQAAVIDIIEKAGLTAADKAKFLRSIKNIQTAEQAQKNLPRINARLETLLDAQARRDALGGIKKAVRKAKKSKVIAADFARAIQDMVAAIDTQGRTPETMQRLQKTLDYFNKNPDQTAPKQVVKKLELLNKKPLEEVSTAELQSLLGDVRRMLEQGKVKQQLKEKARLRRREKRIEELKAGVTPLVSKEEVPRNIGERLNVLDRIKNTYVQAANKARNISLALNPMDVFFDMLDGDKSYTGPAHRIFKQTIDRAFTRYMNYKESITRDVKELSDKLGMTAENFERIGVYAAAQQEGGIEKLANNGYSKAEVEAVTLTPAELQVYNLMRTKLDAMFPRINKVMVDVYNKDVSAVDDYFPFMTDFDAMNEVEITDMVGDDLPAPGAVKKKNTEKGFTESRTGAGKQKIRVDALGVFLQHVDNAAYLVEMGQDIKELGDVAQSDQFKEIAGDIGQQFVVDWVDLLARKGRAPNRVAALDAFRRNTGFAMLGYKLSTILIQPTALMDGSALVGGNYVARGTKAVTKAEWRKFLKDNLPEIRERAGDDPAYMDMGGDSIVAKVRESGFWALKNVDLLTASSVAAGAYIRSVEQRGGTVDLTKPDARAIEEAQLFLRRTQSSAFAKDVPQIISTGKLTGNASLDKLLFQFQSFVLNRWSIIKHDGVAVGIGQKKTAQALNIATWLLLANFAEIGVRRLSKETINALFGAEDLEPWEETIEKEAVLMLLGNVPIAGNIIGSLEYGSAPIPSISLMNNIFQRGSYALQSDDPAKKAKHTASVVFLTTGATLGIPGTMQAEQLMREMTKEQKGKSAF